MYQQRKQLEESAFEPLGPWQPRVRLGPDAVTPDVPLPAEARDTYVVVDEIIEERVRLVASPWPEQDERGRLHFTEPGRILLRWFRRSSLESILNRHRRRAHQVERPLRVGDVFFVQVFVDAAPSRWHGVLDVTSAARPAAKFAFLRAVAQTPGVAEGDPRFDEVVSAVSSAEQVPAVSPSDGPGPSQGSVVNPAV